MRNRFSGQKCRDWHRNFGWIYRTAILAVFLIVLLSLPFLFERSRKLRAPSVPVDDSPGRSLPARTTVRDKSERRLFPYSIIPGGAYSREELSRAIENDPVVARHYDAFNLKSVRLVQLRHNELVYVSYRIGSQIYWTKKQILLSKGETILTDGSHSARTRCGNLLSSTPVAPVFPGEPTAAAMDTAVDPDFGTNASSPDLPFALLPTLPSDPPAGPIASLTAPTGAIGGIPPVVFPLVAGGGGGGVVQSASDVVVPTPEPATLFPLSIGLAAIWLASWRRKTASRRNWKAPH